MAINITDTPSSLIGEGVICFMGEALMFRAGGEGGGSYAFVTEIIESSKVYTVPTGIKNNQIHVRIFGGGGGGGKNGSGASTTCAGGGGGWMNNGWINVSQGSTIQVTIGAGGNGCLYNDNGNSGGTTSFGTYLSAAGGTGGIINGSNIYGGNGGAGGGASSSRNSHGGIGYQFGGGGIWTTGGTSCNNCTVGTGGQWGGNGGLQKNSGTTAPSSNISPENGINTIATIQESDGINALAIGYGKAGVNYGGGGGGYGANGGNGNAGGGGGYGPAGYGGEGRNTCAGGGGAYGHGGGYCTNSSNNVFYISPTHGGGGAGISTAGYKDGANGICIIQYYQKI